MREAEDAARVDGLAVFHLCKHCQRPIDRPHVSPDLCDWHLAIDLAKELVGGRTRVDEPREEQTT